MFRTLTISLFSVAAVATLNAGQIQLGGTNGLVTTGVANSSNLGSSYVINATATSCASGANCLTTNTQNVGPANSFPSYWVEKTYNSSIFQVPTSVTGPAVPLAGSTLTDPNGVKFQLSTAGSSTAMAFGDFGQTTSTSPTAGPYSLIIPVGLTGVTEVDTLLQDYWGSNANTTANTGNAIANYGTSAETTEVVFQFSSVAANGPITTTDTAILTNGVQIRSAIDCLMNCGTNPNGDQTGLAANGSTVTQGDIVISQNNVYTSAYSGITGSSSTPPWPTNSSGNLVLDDQTFSFLGDPTENNDYLVDIIVNNIMAPTYSKVDISAVTVQTAAPEPSSILLFLAGLGSLGVARLRKKA